MMLVDLSRTAFVVAGVTRQDAVRGLQGIPGAKFDAVKSIWRVPIVCAAYLAEYANDHGAQLTEPAQHAIRSLHTERPPTVPIPDLTAPLPSGRVLFAHQRTGVEFLIRRGRAILADDMGLGKTTQALVAARAYNIPVHVLCPASLRDNWAREAQGIGMSVLTHSWAKVPKRIEGRFVLIADEAHYAQSGTKSQRGKSFLALAAEAEALFLLTGTPMKNGRPANLFPLLRAVGSPLAKDKGWFERRYCDAKPTRWSTWDATGASRLPELAERVRPVMLRRMKTECLDLPEKVRVMREASRTAEASRLYTERLHELLMRKEGDTDALAMFTYRRMASSAAKIASACEIIDEILEQDGSIVVFAEYLQTVHEIHAQYKDTCVMLTGATAREERQGLVDRFQRGEARVFVTTFGAGGVGITLTKAQTVLLVDRPWTPGDCYQAEDRIHRIGQTGSSVLSIWLQWDDTDKAVDALLEAKTERIEVVIGGKKQEVQAGISMRKFAEMMR